VDSAGSGSGPWADCCECGDEPSGSGATELVGLLVGLLVGQVSSWRLPWSASDTQVRRQTPATVWHAQTWPCASRSGQALEVTQVPAQ
jgi:hypothetical protein